MIVSHLVGMFEFRIHRNGMFMQSLSQTDLREVTDLGNSPQFFLKSKYEFLTLNSNICVCSHTNFENFKDFLS